MTPCKNSAVQYIAIRAPGMRLCSAVACSFKGSKRLSRTSRRPVLQRLSACLSLSERWPRSLDSPVPTLRATKLNLVASVYRQHGRIFFWLAWATANRRWHRVWRFTMAHAKILTWIGGISMSFALDCHAHRSLLMTNPSLSQSERSDTAIVSGQSLT